LRLREIAQTATIPVIFMTARAQTRELDRFRALGAVGVIPKPFNPMTLATSVHSYVPLPDDPLAELRGAFLQRARKDAAALAGLRTELQGSADAPATLSGIKHIAHGLAGAGGIYGFAEISDTAAALEAEIVDPGAGAGIVPSLDRLLARIETVAA